MIDVDYLIVNEPKFRFIGIFRGRGSIPTPMAIPKGKINLESGFPSCV
jgi:hypothetical protein